MGPVACAAAAVAILVGEAVWGQSPGRPDDRYRNQAVPRYSPVPQQPGRYPQSQRQPPSRYDQPRGVVPAQHEQPTHQQPRLPQHYPPPQDGANRPRPPAGLRRAPFQLSEQQQARVDHILAIWEEESAKVKSYVSNGFERWEYDPVFGPGGDIPKTKSKGQLKYAKPDKGMFKIERVFAYDNKTRDWALQENAIGEHWVCDGQAVYEFNAQQKQLIVRPLPPEMQGKAIADGPLPFLFGAEKEKIERRYFVCITQEIKEKNQIWLKAYPKFQQDAANFDFVELILDSERFLPEALMVYQPGGGDAPLAQRPRTLYLFPDAKVNSPLERFMGVFEKPRTPWGWKKIVEQPPMATDRPSVPDQARRPLQYPR